MATVAKRQWTYKGKTKTAWVVRYTDQTGKERLKTFQSRAEAQKARLDIENEIELGIHTAARASLIIRDLAQKYLKHVNSLREAETIGDSYYRGIELALRCSIVPKLGDIKINELTAEQVNIFTRFMLEEQHLANKTVGERRGVLKRMEEWAGAMGYTKKRVTEAAKTTFRLKKSDPIRIPSQDEVSAILRAVDALGTNPRAYRGSHFVRLYVHLAAFCGLRFGEITGLTIDNLDFAAGIIRVRHNMTATNKLKGPKTEAGIRDVPMAHGLGEELKVWLSTFTIPNKRNLVLTSARGMPVLHANWHKHYWKPLLSPIGLYPEDEAQRIHFHSLRHFCGSWWIKNGIPITLVSKWLGHASPQMTLSVYAHAISTADEEQAAMARATGSLLALHPTKTDMPTLSL